MRSRVAQDAQDGDAGYFSAVLLEGELYTKLVLLGSLALLDARRVPNYRYDVEHALIRANGVGAWTFELQRLITGPAKVGFPDHAAAIVAQLSQRFPSGSDAWQREVLDELREAEKALGLDGLDPRTKTALTSFFSRFSELRNKSKGHRSPQTANQGEAARHLDRALSLLANNLSLLTCPWIVLWRTATGDLRSHSLSGTQTQIDLSGLDEGLHLEVGARLFPVNLLTFRQPMDLLVANGDYRDRDNSYEALSYVTSAVDRLGASAFVAAPTMLSPSETQGRSELDLIGQTWGNIPPPKADYVARLTVEHELLDRLLDSEQDPIVTLGGPGGIGKTSTALQVLHEVADRGDFDSILWFSARDVDLLDAEGPVRVKPEVLSFADAADVFWRLMQPMGYDLGDGDHEDKFSAALRGAGTSGDRMLFVFDNFETILEPNALFQVLKSHVRLPNKLLITTRFTDFKGQYPVDIAGMDFREFQELVDTTASRLGIVKVVRESSQYVRTLHQESYGHPYVVKIVLGEVARNGKVPEKFDRILGRREDILDALFLRSLERLSPDSQRVFLTLCNWHSVVPFVMLEAVLRRSANEQVIDVESAVDELETSSMIEIIRPPGLEEPRWINVPGAAFKFGASRAGSHKDYSAIRADAELLRLVGTQRLSQVGDTLELAYFFNRLSDGLRGQQLDRQDLIEVAHHVSTAVTDAWLPAAETFFREGIPREALRCMLRDAPKTLDDWTTPQLSLRYKVLRSMFDERQLETVFVLVGRLIEGGQIAEACDVAQAVHEDLRAKRLSPSAPQRAALFGKVVDRFRAIEERVDGATAGALADMSELCNRADDARMWRYVQRLRK